ADGLTHHRREGDDHTRDQQRLRGDHYWRWPGGAGHRLLPAASRRGHPGPRRSGGCRWGVAACVAINDVVFHRGVFSLPGKPMPAYEGFPPSDHVIDYLADYEQRYRIPVERPVHVDRVEREDGGYRLHAGDR